MIFNTLKITVAAIVSILLATVFHLNYAVSAGTVTILSIQPTKRETIKTATGRLLAFLCALGISYMCFNIWGYTLIGYAVYLLVYIFVCQIFHWYSSMAVNSVLISHILTAGDMSGSIVLNECLLFCFGVSIGIIANLHLRKNVNYIEELKESTDNQIKRILHRMAERILDSNLQGYDGDCFTALRESITKAKYVAEKNYNNQLRVNDIYDKEYIRMREKQCFVLYEMYKNASQIHTTPITAKKISAFLEEVAEAYHKSNTGKELLEKFSELDTEMKSQPLPVTREEFEDRARLFFLLQYMEEFIRIKAEFVENL